VRVLFRELDYDAISITDTERILAFEGAESAHHLPGDPVATNATRASLRDCRVTVARSHDDVSCSHPRCRLACGVIAPLVVSGAAVGTVKFYRVAPGAITDADEFLAAGLSRLLSTQLELYEVEVQRRLAAEAQARALKAQIHPHFIFNVLNTISSACVVDPPVARTVVLRLSSLLRRTFRIRTEFITLQEELALVREYLEIESIRFPDMISYHEEVGSDTMRLLVPVLILQPLVENCVIHGLEGSHIHITVRARLHGERLLLDVEDDGRGLTAAELADLMDDGSESREGVGIRNTRRRLQAHIGEQGQITLAVLDPGLRVTLSLAAARETPVAPAASARTSVGAPIEPAKGRVRGGPRRAEG
jgi:two-component system sensor histidine kinase LytS